MLGPMCSLASTGEGSVRPKCQTKLVAYNEKLNVFWIYCGTKVFDRFQMIYLYPYKHTNHTLLHTVITNVYIMSHLPFLSNKLVA